MHKRLVMTAVGLGVLGLVGCSSAAVDGGIEGSTEAQLAAAGFGNLISEPPGSGVGDPGCVPDPRISARVLCFSVGSQAQVFAASKPGEAVNLVPAQFTLDPDSASSEGPSTCQPDTNPAPFPQSFASSMSAIYQACGWGSAPTKTGFFSLQEPLPHADRVAVYATNPVDANNVAACNQPTYIWCKVSPFDAGTQEPLFGFTLGNNPLIVQIQNNLPTGHGNTLELVSPPAATRLVLDSNVGTPTQIAPGASGYFGGYLAIPTSAMVNPTIPSGGYPNAGFAVMFEVPNTATGMQAKGTTFLINAVFDSATGQLDTAHSYCDAAVPSSDDSMPECSQQLVGQPGGTQTLLVTVGEQS